MVVNKLLVNNTVNILLQKSSELTCCDYETQTLILILTT